MQLEQQQLQMIYLQFLVCLCVLTHSYSGPENGVKIQLKVTFIQKKNCDNFLVFGRSQK